MFCGESLPSRPRFSRFTAIPPGSTAPSDLGAATASVTTSKTCWLKPVLRFAEVQHILKYNACRPRDCDACSLQWNAA